MNDTTAPGPANHVAYASAAPHAPWWEREDPYWQQWLFARAPLLRVHADTTRTVDDRGIATVATGPAAVDDTTWARTLRSPVTHELIAAAAAFHHATTKQLCALTSTFHPASSRYLRPMHHAGLTLRGRFSPDRRVPGRLSWIHAPDHSSKHLRRWMRQLDPDVAADVAGHPDGRIRGGEPHIRHNLLAAEVVLRTLEVQPNIVGWWPETTATPAALVGDPDAPAQFETDLVLHRADGLRIAVEVSASGDRRHLARKIERWASVLAGWRYQDVGLIVVLLNARHADHGKLTSQLKRLHADLVQHGKVRHVNGTLADPAEVAQARTMLHVASWRDWYPSRHAIAAAGRDLTTWVRDGRDRWQPARCADPAEVPMPGRAVRPPLPRTLAAAPGWAGIEPGASRLAHTG